ncbi:magnesium transporter CorA family protein [Anaerocolumna sp. MB42-C2]|uniref:magnesium transporter CorA family protein n=1 Tax=Anaerocolumna sp. MB42-C2 TaxID=3070997 RepID=UPI0027DFFE88|nr:CorA family divalent cation transporter [Anaerocolumna sp. MB42-C2]WMJ85709.1 CorA family divalent cation transporter [Anaerocolumna sp. MB42-C2]
MKQTMYYQIQNEISPITLKDYNPDILTFGIITLDELDECYESFGFALATVMECKNDTHEIHGEIEVYDDYHFGIITGIETKHFIRVQDRIGIYIKSNLFLIVVIEDQDDSMRVELFESLKHVNLSKVTLERLIYGFLERLILNNYSSLEKIEEEISDHEDKINDNRLDRNFNYEITGIRKRLLLLDNFYEQLIVIGEELEENAIDIFCADNLRYFKLFTDRVTRLSNNTRMLQDYSDHVRDSYHAQLDYNLNNIMKMFTVVTTIFLPLTLIVGWYGMNFTYMPELHWKYGYLFVIIISIIVAILCIFYFKKKKFL